MKRRFIIALSDSYGMHMIATDVDSEEEYKRISALMKKWKPKATPNPPYGKRVLAETIFESLKELTGYEFYVFKPDYYVTNGDREIKLPSVNEWKEDTCGYRQEIMRCDSN